MSTVKLVGNNGSNKLFVDGVDLSHLATKVWFEVNGSNLPVVHVTLMPNDLSFEGVSVVTENLPLVGGGLYTQPHIFNITDDVRETIIPLNEKVNKVAEAIADNLKSHSDGVVHYHSNGIRFNDESLGEMVKKIKQLLDEDQWRQGLFRTSK